MPTPATTIEVEGREIRVSNPDKVLFPAIGVTKMELVEYYLTVADAALIGCRDRPTIMHRFPHGVDGEPFYQKRVPAQRPPWVQTATITFPSGRHAVMIAPADAAHLAWMANLACLDLNPWPVRRDDVDHPDELRVDLDPTPGVPWDDVRRVTLVVRDVLEEHGTVGFPATSGKRGMHLVVPIVREHGVTTVRRAALALAREVTRRAPGVATTAWWKEERQGVFVDYNQNARDRTVASVYSVRPVSDARVATPLSWDEVADVDPSVFTIRTVPDRLATIGDPGAGADPVERSSLDGLLELAARDEAGGLGDAPWPPHFPKGDSEPVRVNPSRARKVAEWEASRRARKGGD
jgi:bifunctional non-homologous end joining protein LigD